MSQQHKKTCHNNPAEITEEIYIHHCVQADCTKPPTIDAHLRLQFSQQNKD